MNRMIAKAAWRLPLYFVLLLLVASCSSNASDSNNPAGNATIAPYPDGAGPPPMEPKNCNSFPFERTEFEAGEAILFSLPPDIDRASERAMWLHSDSLVIPYPLDIMTAEGVNERNGLFLPIPSSIGTTKYTLQLAGKLSDGTAFSCPTHDIEVTLAEAEPGTALQVGRTIERIVDGMSAQSGGNRETLEAIIDGTAGEVDGVLMPLAISNFYLHHEDGLLNALETTDAEQMRHIDAVFAVIARMGTLPELASSFDGVASGATALKVKIESASDLSYWTKQRTSFCGMLTSSYATAVTAAGLVAVKPNPVGVAAAAFALTGGIILEMSQAACDLFPSKIENLKFQGPVRVLEDEAGVPNVGSPIQVYASFVTVDARSGQWSWAGSAIRLVLQYLSTGGAAKQLSARLDDLPKGVTLFQSLKVPPVTQKWLVDGLRAFLNNLRDWRIGKLVALEPVTNVLPSVGPFEWRGIQLNANRWIRMITRTGVVRQNESDPVGPVLYRFSKVGEDSVVVVPRVEEFPLRDLDEQLLFMGVDKIEIDVPEELLLLPGESVDIPFSVRNAVDVSLEWHTPEGALVGSTDIRTDEPMAVVEHTAPSDPTAFPYTIEVASGSQTGLRTPSLNPPNRSKYILVRSGDVSISPRGVCVPNGETLELRVATSSLLAAEPESLTLQGEGTLSGRTYTAPAEGSGTVEVTVTVGAFSDRTTFSYGACTCYFSVVSREGAHSREYGMVLSDFSIGDFVERGDSVAPIVTMSMGESLTQILTDPRYILTFAPGFWKTATMREGLDGDFTADLRGESQFDPGWFSNGGYLETDALQYLGRPRLTGKGVVYHGDPENPFPVNVAFSMVFDDSICATESLFRGFSAYPDYPRPDVEVF
ncbi:MAG: hypothetical protein R3E66_01390 [bacterium]